MEQTEEYSSLMELLTPETRHHIVLRIISLSKNTQEAITTLNRLKDTNNFKGIINNPTNTRFFIEALCKRFKIDELIALHLLPTKDAHQQLRQKLDTITKYTFVHHNTLLLEDTAQELIKSGHQFVTKIALECALDTLKTNKEPWEDSENITDAYNQLISKNTINISVSAYRYPKQGKRNALRLLCLAQSYTEFLGKVKKNITSNAALFSELIENTDDVLFNNKGKTDKGKELSQRIKTHKNNTI